MSTLSVVWFFLIAFLLVGYTTLAGFDLGIGMLHAFTRKKRDSDTMLAAIGPFWDGNEVWLVATGGALFAAFPPVYATVFSGFYLALILLLFALALRAMAIDFGAKVATEKARNYWGVLLAITSTTAVLLFGIAFGNILRGLPLDAAGNYLGSFWTLLHPFALLVGVLNIAMLATHGALYLTLRAPEVMAARARRWAHIAWGIYLPLALATLSAAGIEYHHLVRNYLAIPILWLLPLATLSAIVLAEVWNTRQRARRAFTASAAAIILLLATAVTALFPILVPAQHNIALSLTVTNASSSHTSQLVMLIITLIGMPIVLLYTSFVYRLFGGKLKEGEEY